MNEGMKVLSVEALTTIGGVILLAQIVFMALIEPALEIKLGSQEPKETRDPRWPIMTNISITMLSLVGALLGAYLWTKSQGGLVDGVVVANGILLGISAAGSQILGYEFVKNFNKRGGG